MRHLSRAADSPQLLAAYEAMDATNSYFAYAVCRTYEGQAWEVNIREGNIGTALARSYADYETATAAALELYCALREIEVPAEKARGVVEAIAAARKPTPSRAGIEKMSAWDHMLDPRPQQLESELWDLRFKSAADTLVIRFTGLMLGVLGLVFILHHMKW